MLCKNCTLDSAQAGIDFNPDTGLCQFCESYTPVTEKQRARKQEQMDAYFTRKGPGLYDVIFALSGGKDSSCALLKLAHDYPSVRILAVQFNNGYISPVALENAKTVCKAAGAEYYAVSYPREVMERAFASSAASMNVYPPIARIRASDICNTCMNVVKQIVIGQALLHGAPSVIFAFTPGQTSKAAIVMSKNMIVYFRNLFLRQLEQLGIAGDADRLVIPSALLDSVDNHHEVVIVHPYNIWQYDEAEILRMLPEYGWKQPKIDDANSTNCLINAPAIRNHIHKYGIHPYAFDIAGMVRCGLISRDEGVKRLAADIAERGAEKDTYSVYGYISRNRPEPGR